MNKKGFTIVELLIVIAVLSILAMIAVPVYIGQQKRAARTEAYANLQNLRLLEEQYYAENGCYYQTGSPVACSDSTISGVNNIQAFLPGFRPGNVLNYSYSITTSAGGTGGGNASSFVATATGATSRVSGDTFTIDNNNNRNF